MSSTLKLIFLFILGIVSSTSLRANKLDDSQTIETADYELFKPCKKPLGVLILFGGYPETIQDIKREFKILDQAKKEKFAVLYMSFNRKLFLTQAEKTALQTTLETAFELNQLPTESTYIGGFSSGGNITLLLSNHLIAANAKVQPKGLFVIDSPVDLLELYRLFKRNIERNFSEKAIEESKYMIGLMEEEMGLPEDGIEKYEAFSPFVSETNNMQNLMRLDGVKMRFYSEPDTTWWKENRNNEPNDLNAHWIEKLQSLMAYYLKKSEVVYFETINMGYRANGDRHPHSWSIVDVKDLMSWMTKK